MLEKVVFVAIGVVCGAVLGFWLGRVSAKYYVGEDEADRQERTGAGTGTSEESSNIESENMSSGRFESNGTGKVGQNRLWYERRRLGEEERSIIGSPVSGGVIDYSEGKRPEISLYPSEEKMYAPTGGKVIRLFPLGNEFLFRTEEGRILRLKVGEGADELQSDYFRPKVIQNEVVNKGKLLLEFDKRGLEAEGVECSVSVRVEEIGLGEKVAYIAEGNVKAGEEIFEINHI